MTEAPTYDAIVVGSGAAGGTLARELALRGQRVLVLEKGRGEPDPDSKVEAQGRASFVLIGRGVPVLRGIGVGGTTMLFFNTMWDPPFDHFRALGIELAAEVEEARKEIPVAPLADALVGPVASRIMRSARGSSATTGRSSTRRSSRSAATAVSRRAHAGTRATT